LNSVSRRSASFFLFVLFSFVIAGKSAKRVFAQNDPVIHAKWKLAPTGRLSKAASQHGPPDQVRW
jgi:hypothetical protein